MKKLFKLLFITLLLFISCNKIYADVPSVSNDIHVTDLAGLLTSEEVNTLENELRNLSNKYGMDILIHTTNTTNGLDTRDYADDFYDYNNYADDGVVLVIDMENYNMYISTKGKGIDYFTDYGIDYIFNNIENSLSNGEYYNAFKRYISDSDYLISEGISGNIIDIDNKPQRFGLGNISISAIIAAISSGISSLVFKGQLKSVSKQKLAQNYVVDNSFVLTGMSDMLVNKNVTRHLRSRSSSNSSSGHSGGGSSVHTSSSGSTHGGHGRGF